MYLFASSAFGGLSCLGLIEILRDFGVTDLIAGCLAVGIVCVLSFIQNLWRYE